MENGKKMVGGNGLGLYHRIQHNSGNTWIQGFWMCDKLYKCTMLECGSNMDARKHCFAHYQNNLNIMLKAVCSIWAQKKNKGNHTITRQNMTLVNVSYQQPNSYFCMWCFSAIWHRLVKLGTKISDFPSSCFLTIEGIPIKFPWGNWHLCQFQQHMNST